MQATETIQATSQGKLRKLIFEYQYLWIIISGLMMAFITEPAFAQCVGWMCGPKDALTANEVVGGNPSAGIFINFIFLAIQVMILLALGALAVALFFKLNRDEDYVKPLIALLVALLLIFGSNYIAGFVVGDGTGTGGTDSTAGTTVGNPTEGLNSGARTVFN